DDHETPSPQNERVPTLGMRGTRSVVQPAPRPPCSHEHAARLAWLCWGAGLVARIVGTAVRLPTQPLGGDRCCFCLREDEPPGKTLLHSRPGQAPRRRSRTFNDTARFARMRARARLLHLFATL